ncbi:MAG: hypothetical protein JRD64_06975 [Deltaproteobacteria bacterium]|jgi:hypothetical protein|nr:hypothetical protein [Deltaproteobacteria bacterium]
MPKTSTMNFQKYLEDTYRIIMAEPVILILGGLLIQLLTVFSLGILAGPLLGGYFLVVIGLLRDKRKPSFSDIFSGLQQFGSLFPYFLVLLLIFIGFMLLILPGLLFASWWIYVLPLMVDRNISYSEAMRLSMNRVNETGFIMHLVFLLLISVIPIMLLNFVSAMIPFLFVLKILLPPLQAGCIAALYLDQFGSGQEAAGRDTAPEPGLGVTAGSPLPEEREPETEKVGEEDRPAAEEAEAAGSSTGTEEALTDEKQDREKTGSND